MEEIMSSNFFRFLFILLTINLFCNPLNAQTEEEQKRIQKLEKTTSQKTIIKIAQKDPSPLVRFEAAKKITDQKSLASIVINDTSEFVATKVLNLIKDNNVIKTIIKSKVSSKIWKNALSRISIYDRNMAVDIIGEYKDKTVRLEMFNWMVQPIYRDFLQLFFDKYPSVITEYSLNSLEHNPSIYTEYAIRSSDSIYSVEAIERLYLCPQDYKLYYSEEMLQKDLNRIAQNAVVPEVRVRAAAGLDSVELANEIVTKDSCEIVRQIWKKLPLIIKGSIPLYIKKDSYFDHGRVLFVPIKDKKMNLNFGPNGKALALSSDILTNGKFSLTISQNELAGADSFTLFFESESYPKNIVRLWTIRESPSASIKEFSSNPTIRKLNLGEVMIYLGY